MPERTIGWAIAAMRAKGCRVARCGWNGKGMYLVYQKGYPDGIPINRNTAEATGLPEGTECKFLPCIMMRTADGSFVPWLCSQTDLLAVDWEEYTNGDAVMAAAQGNYSLAELRRIAKANASELTTPELWVRSAILEIASVASVGMPTAAPHLEREGLWPMATYFGRGRRDRAQDEFENVPFGSVGGHPHRLVKPNWIPASKWPEYARGYLDGGVK